MSAPYSRVYWSVMDDDKFDGIREDPRLMGSWLILLIVADMAHPAPAMLPPTVPRLAVTRLEKAGLIDLLSGYRYRVHGLEAERGRRSEAAAVGGRASGRSRSVERPLNERSRLPGTDVNSASPGPGTESNLDETSIDEHRQDKDKTSTARANDPWDDPEHEALVWLNRHGCDIRPGNGYHQQLVTAVERHGVNAIVGMFDRLASAGTKNGDLKGFLFPAIDALDKQTRPSLVDFDKAAREEQRDSDFARRVAKTRAATAEMRAVLTDGSSLPHDPTEAPR